MSVYEEADARKAIIDAERPFGGDMLRQLREYYRVGLTWASNALEGNSLTEIETKVLLEDGLTVGGKPLRDTFEAVGHANAYDYMLGLLAERKITVENIQTLHRLFYKSIDESRAGVWRDVNIVVTGSTYNFPPPAALQGLVEELCLWMETERPAIHPIRFAAMLHLKFVTIHPFIDGNGRVARLLMNTALLQDGYMLAVVPPVLRTEYLSAIQKYQRQGSDGVFCDFIAERVLETEKDVIRLLRL